MDDDGVVRLPGLGRWAHGRPGVLLDVILTAIDHQEQLRREEGCEAQSQVLKRVVQPQTSLSSQ